MSIGITISIGVTISIGHTNQRRRFLPVDCVRQQARRTGRLKGVTPVCIAVQGLVSARPYDFPIAINLC